MMGTGFVSISEVKRLKTQLEGLSQAALETKLRHFDKFDKLNRQKSIIIEILTERKGSRT